MTCGSGMNGSWVPQSQAMQAGTFISVSDSKASDRQSYKKPRGSEARWDLSASATDAYECSLDRICMLHRTRTSSREAPAWDHNAGCEASPRSCSSPGALPSRPRPVLHALPVHADMRVTSVTCHVGTVPRLYHKFGGDAERSTEPEEKIFYRVCHFDDETAVQLDEHGPGKHGDPAAT